MTWRDVLPNVVVESSKDDGEWITLNIQAWWYLIPMILGILAAHDGSVSIRNLAVYALCATGACCGFHFALREILLWATMREKP